MHNRFFLALLFIPLLGYSKIDLFSLSEKDERPLIKPEIIQEEKIEVPIEKGVQDSGFRVWEKRGAKKIIKKESPPKKPLEPKEKMETVTTQIIEETMPFEMVESAQIEEEKRPLWVIFSLAITSFSAIILIFLIFIHLVKREKKVNGPLFQVPPSNIEDELKNLKQSSKIVSSKVSEIETMVPREFVEGLKSGKLFSQIAKDVIISLEPRIRELGLAYQGIKKSLTQIDYQITSLESLKSLNFKDLARQTATEFIMPLQNEFNKTKLSYESMLSGFEERQDGRLSTIEKKYVEVRELVDEVHKRLVGLESLITSATMFEQEPIIRTKKREEVISPVQKTPREELNKLIYELADSGLSVDDIAKKTKIGKGEINLILSFRKKR